MASPSQSSEAIIYRRDRFVFFRRITISAVYYEMRKHSSVIQDV